MIGSTVDKYEVLQKVGEGGMATVYRGRHTTLDRDVAIKVLHPHLSSSTRNRKRFAREARAIEHLRHQNILEIFDYSGIESGDCYIITEFVEGQTLSTLVEKRGQLPSELVARIGIELCGALAYAHASGILHRDLKPDNVMIRHDGTIKLMDFGIARFLDESQVTLTGALVGSPAFMSPEQALEGTLDARSDLFSLGTVLFYLVSGMLPFTGSNPSLILKNVIEGNRPSIAELVPSISPALADVVERLMSTDPNGRFTTAGDAAEGLRESLRECDIPEDPHGDWSIASYLLDPDAWEARLTTHVRARLLEVGKARLAGGDALGALRLFNRLLAVDEGHPEVLELIQALHAEPVPVARRRVPVVVGGLAGLGVAIGLLVVLLVPVLRTWSQAPQIPRQPAPVEVAVAEPAGPTQEPVRRTSIPEPEPEPEIGVSPSPRPAPRPLPDPVAAPSPNGPGRLRLVSNLPADVYHQGRKLGNTRIPLELEPGSYLLEIRSDVVQTYSLRVDIGPDEDVERRISVQARPALVRFARDVPGTCQVLLDGVMMGTVSALGRRIEVPEPEKPGHEISVRCADVEVIRRRWDDVVLPDEVIAP